MYVCMHACMYICMYACMHVYVCVFIYVLKNINNLCILTEYEPFLEIDFRA